MISKKEFNSLKVGDEVICDYGSKAEVLCIGIKDFFTGREMVKLKAEKKKWACPYFFRTEIKCKVE